MTKLPLTPHIEGILERAKEAAKSMHRNRVDLDLFFHFFLSDLSLSCLSVLKNTNIKSRELLVQSKAILNKKRRNKKVSEALGTDVRKLLKSADKMCSENLGLDYIPPEVIFMNFFDKDHCPKLIKKLFPEGDKQADDLLVRIITECSLIIKDFESELEIKLEREMSELGIEVEGEEVQWIDMFEENEILSQFAENLNLKAINGEFDKIVDFDGKIDELATILCRKKKPNAILVGPAGTGKTSLVEGLAFRIANGDAPELIANKVIYSVSLSSMVAGTEYRGQFEKRLEEFVKEAKKYSNLILFIDEVHTLIGAGGTTNQSLEASNMLKPELARGTISCIGATTINEYTKTIKKDTALDRRFERVVVREPSKFQMLEILPTIISYYEDFHGVEFTDEFLNNLIDYCEKYTPNKFYPDKAIDVIDHCGAQAKVNFWEDSPLKDIKAEANLLEGADHASVVDKLNSSLKKWTEEANLKETPKVRMSHLKEFFTRKVNPLNKKGVIDKIFQSIEKSFVGQREVLKSIRDKVVLSSFGLTDDNFSTPDCFAISGDRSSGKSFFVDLFVDALRKHGVNVLSYNGVHFSDGFAPYKIAADKGNNTSICEKITMYPNSVLIIDDFHKIDPSAVPIFNQILKEGKLQMNNGDVADFSNCKIFITSSLSSGQASMGFQEQKVTKENLTLHKDILPLIGDCFFLKKLTPQDLRRLLWSKLKRIKKELKTNGVDLSFDFDFIYKTVSKVIKDKAGVTSLNNKISKEITPFISEEILKGKKKINL